MVVVNLVAKCRLIFLLSGLMLSMGSSVAIARCDEKQENSAIEIAVQALSATDEFDRVMMLKRSLRVCPDFAVWLALGKTELALDNPIDAAYALENARDFYTPDRNNAYSSSQVLRQAIANAWLAETYYRDDELALAIVATQEATSGFELLGQGVPGRLIVLQAEIDDALANADATVLTRSFEIQHKRASRGIGVRPRIRAQNEPVQSQAETAQLLAEYSGDASVEVPPITTVAVALPNALPAATPTESRLNIPVLFEFDSDQLTSASVKTVTQLAAAIQALNLVSKDTVLVVGHTDAQGNEAYNLALSQRRAESVLRQILQISDINAELVAAGKGEAELRYFGNNNDDHRRNRRVEMVIRR